MKNLNPGYLVPALAALLLVVIGSPLPAAQRAGTTYYISPSGDDANGGRAPDDAWQTIGRANAFDFEPGDSILFEGRSEYSGSLLLTAEDCLGGSTGAPTTISSYGEGSATLRSGLEPGVRVLNCDHTRIHNLIVTGQAGNEQNGITIRNTFNDDRMLAGITVSQIYVTGYRYGVVIRAGMGMSGFEDVTLSNIRAFYNVQGGILVRWDYYDKDHTTYPLSRVTVANNVVAETSGDAGVADGHSGSGIIVANAEDVLIENNRVYNNGALNSSDRFGPVGIWAWDCANTVMQFNHSWRNRSNSIVDGGGINLDGGCRDSVMQYNVTHDNDGAGIMVGQFAGARPMDNITVRYNLSVNDGRRNRYGGLHLFKARNSEMSGVFFYNNTVYMSPASNNPSAFAIHHNFTDGAQDILVANNLFITGDGARLVDVSAPNNDILFVGNNYDSSGEAFRITYLGATYTSLGAWRSATGQERLGGAGVATGLAVPAQVAAAGGTDAADYQLRGESALINAGLDIWSLFGIDPGPHDHFGNPLPAFGAFDVGMHEFPEPATPTPTPTQTPTPGPTHTPTPTLPAPTPDPRDHFLYLPVNLR